MTENYLNHFKAAATLIADAVYTEAKAQTLPNAVPLSRKIQTLAEDYSSKVKTPHMQRALEIFTLTALCDKIEAEDTGDSRLRNTVKAAILLACHDIDVPVDHEIRTRACALYLPQKPKGSVPVAQDCLKPATL